MDGEQSSGERLSPIERLALSLTVAVGVVVVACMSANVRYAGHRTCDGETRDRRLQVLEEGRRRYAAAWNHEVARSEQVLAISFAQRGILGETAYIKVLRGPDAEANKAKSLAAIAEYRGEMKGFEDSLLALDASFDPAASMDPVLDSLEKLASPDMKSQVSKHRALATTFHRRFAVSPPEDKDSPILDIKPFRCPIGCVTDEYKRDKLALEKSWTELSRALEADILLGTGCRPDSGKM
ncbi:MAG: hypothetical protein GMKNLPBB_01325 [Myxococcota bacterium]|nr:hypothetical protein [Myxococcota bacterium]